MTKDNIKRILGNKKSNALDISKALKEFWTSQNFYKRPPYQTTSPQDILSVAQEVFSS